MIIEGLNNKEGRAVLIPVPLGLKGDALFAFEAHIKQAAKEWIEAQDKQSEI